MNIERMLYLADQLEDPTDPKLRFIGFDMGDFAGVNYVEDAITCGTSACIGGHACILFGEGDTLITEVSAARLLDLGGPQTRELFYENFEQTRKEAAEKIRRMVEEEQEKGDVHP